MPSKVQDWQFANAHRAMTACGGNRAAAARQLGIPSATLFYWLKLCPWHPGVAEPTLAQPQISPSFEEIPAPPQGRATVPAEPGRTRVVLMTAAQDETPLADGALEALQTYAAFRGGEIMIGGFTYQKGLFEEHKVRSGVFAQNVVPYLRPEIVELSPRLVWYGAANILPTAVDPLSGWETNTREKWAVFPHAKIALRCVPTMPGRPGKQIMTTGVITKPNYVQRNAGQKAEFHHTPGATIAEIKPDGTFFLRQIGIGKDGSFQDLDYVVRGGEVTTGNRVESVTWGDIHFEEMDRDVARILWGWPKHGTSLPDGSMLDDLRPYTQFFHDSFSFKARSHHTINDPHERALRVEEDCDNVETMLTETARFLAATERDWCRSLHVSSNHNEHLSRWLKDIQGHFDPINAKLWHRINAAWFQAIDDGEGEHFSASAYGLRELGGQDLRDMTFLHAGESFLICQGGAPIECALHGDVGPRGARGSPLGMSKIVERVTSAHTHEPQIRDGAYIAGTSSRLDIKYAVRGPTAWQHAEVVTYPNGRRTIVTLQNGSYRS